MDYRTAHIALGRWRRVLVRVEYAMQDAAVEWDPVSYGSAAVVQDASDRAVAQYSGPKTTLGWPPDEYIMAIVLSEREWTWLLQQMEIWHTGEGSDELKQVLIDALGDPTLS